METKYKRGKHPNSIKNRFSKGIPGPWLGKKRQDLSGKKHPNWTGGIPKCWCGKQLKSYRAKNCTIHSFTKDRIEKIKRGGQKRKMENHHAWLGERVSYRGIHAWVVNNFGQPNKCENCRKISRGHNMHWANISGKYTRNRSDWKRLCSKCHGEFDKVKRKK